MMVLRKKTIIILTLVVLIVAAGYISTKYGRALKVNNDKDTEQTTTSDGAVTSTAKVAEGYFIDVKLGRENERTALKQDLALIIDNKNATAASKTEAEKQLMSMVDRAEKEMIIEDLIKSKGYEDAVVLLTEDSANVTIRTKEITKDQVSLITNIVVRESKLSASKVMVQPKE